MIGIRCVGKDFLPLRGMRLFQGDLKSRTKEQLNELKESLRTEGLLAPFFVWKGALANGGYGAWLLDGHARYEALSSMAEDDSELWDAMFPVVYIEADGPDGAKKALLQITSDYGKVTRKGAREFCASIPGYRAPSVAAFLKPVSPLKEKAVSLEDAPVLQRMEPETPGADEVKLVIAVPSAYRQAALELFNSVSYIRVL